jgi:D-beta-D-heptose 7-phosphate kinase / D-beta-D-heptose 1-phosphate adenosyltransferase
MIEFNHDNERVIFTNGVFDLLHIGHIKFLQACKALGGRVVVGINSDSSVKRLKGEYRPINSELHRKHMLLALDCVDEVIVFVEDNPLEIIQLLQPEIYVKSDEYLNVKLPEFKAVESYGGYVAIVTPDPELRKVKTSNTIDKIVKAEMERRFKDADSGR